MRITQYMVEVARITAMDNVDRKKLLDAIFNLVEEINKDDFLNREMMQLFFEECGVEVRICDVCDSIMVEGYVAGGGSGYYCTEDCLNRDIGELEWKKLTAYLTDEEDRTEEEQQWYEEYGDTDSYWTEWV